MTGTWTQFVPLSRVLYLTNRNLLNSEQSKYAGDTCMEDVESITPLANWSCIE